MESQSIAAEPGKGALSKERDYLRAVRRAAAAVNSLTPLSGKLDNIIRGTAMAAKAAASLILLDSTGTKLVHSASFGLPYFFLQKGLLDPAKSVAEVVSGKPVVIADVAMDKRVQYPEMAKKARIVSVLGVPVMQNGKAVGAVRLYAREKRDFSGQDINFITAIADLTATALSSDLLLREKEELIKSKSPAVPPAALIREAHPTVYAHPSEEEFAHLLDFYNIPWIYEPRAFPLEWDGERVTEMFTPDFYLPTLDLYVELTTMKQKLATIKNHKIRRIHELYPDIKITLLRKGDYERLLAKYGAGPLSLARAHGISRILYTAADIDRKVRELAGKISQDYAGRRPLLVGAQRGFLCFMADLMRQITIPLDLDFISISHYGENGNRRVAVNKEMVLPIAGRDIIMVEDIVDTGITLSYIQNYFKEKGPVSFATCVLLDRPARRIADVKLDYVGFEIPDEFVVGYGLDFREEYRNLPFIGVPIIETPAMKKISTVEEKKASAAA